MENCGIYMFTYNQYCYVGQTVNLHKRIAGHKRMLMNGNHPNMDKIKGYNFGDISFTILEECSPSQLNKKEIEYFNKLSDKYEMLNVRACGLQKDMSLDQYFLLDKTPSLKLKDGNFFIDDIKIDKDENGLFCLSQLVDFILDNSTYSVRLNEIINSLKFRERILALYKDKGLVYSTKRDIVKRMKDAGIYKCIGSRSNRRIYCDFGVFITFAFMSCAPFGASVCLMIK